MTVQIHDNGGTANGGVDTSRAADVHDHRQRRSTTRRASPRAPTRRCSKTPARRRWPAGRPAISAGPADEVGPGAELHRQQRQQRAVLGAAGDRRRRHADLHAGGQRQRHARRSPSQLHDNGGTANGGVDTSAPQTFTITVTPVNDAPSFTKGADQTVLEDAGAQTVDGWATGDQRRPGERSRPGAELHRHQRQQRRCSPSQPAIAANGTLTYTPAANANGTATVTVQVHDNGGTANGGVDTSRRADLHDHGQRRSTTRRRFTKGADQTVLEDAGAQTVTGWATGICRRPGRTRRARR